MDGWGMRVYSVASKSLGTTGAGCSSDGWSGTFPVGLLQNDVKNAFVAHISGRGHGAPEVRIQPTMTLFETRSLGALGVHYNTLAAQ